MASKRTHYGRVAMLYTAHHCARGIRYRVRLPSQFNIGRQGGGQEHYVSAYASFFARDFDVRHSIAECGIEFVPRGRDPNSGAWSTFLNPAAGTTQRRGRPASGQRGLHAPAQSSGQIVNFEMLLKAPDEGTFSVNGAPFNAGKFVPSVPLVNRDDQAEARRKCFDEGVNARIAIGYNDEGMPEVFIRDFSIEVTQPFSRTSTASSPGPGRPRLSARTIRRWRSSTPSTSRHEACRRTSPRGRAHAGQCERA